STPSLAPTPPTERRADWPPNPLPLDPSEANIQAAELGAPLAIQELGLAKLDSGDAEGGITLLGECLDHPQCGMAGERVVRWALENDELPKALEWAPRLVNVLKSLAAGSA
ncbi:hypothetical protein AB0I24_05485, partial [Brachybacterium paraconglomeratum]